MNEFDIIQRYFQRAVRQDDNIRVGIGDDAAVVSVPAGQELVLTMDTLHEGVHFPANARPADVGWKALAVNLSDLAAMGAVPQWVTLSLTLPEALPDWLGDFSQGLFQIAHDAGVNLIGGDVTRGPLSVTVQAHGFVPVGKALLRGNARVGDQIYVSGWLGDAGHALTLTPDQQDDYFRGRLQRPQPRIALGRELRDLAHAAIDISDGLAGDLRHILNASHCGARVEMDRLPISGALARAVDMPTARHYAVSAGDDYELCFTADPAAAERIAVLSGQLELPLTVIGTIEAGAQLTWHGPEGDADHTAFRHF